MLLRSSTPRRVVAAAAGLRVQTLASVCIGKSSCCASAVLMSRRHRSRVAAFFALPISGFTAKSAEAREREARRRRAEETEAQQRQMYTLGDFLDRMPPLLRALLVWSPVALLLYFCGHQQRCYYLEADERLHCLLLPRAVRRWRAGDGGAVHLRSLLTAPPEEYHPSEEEKAHPAPPSTSPRDSAAVARPCASSWQAVAGTTKGMEGCLLMQRQRIRYLSPLEVQDPQRHDAPATQRGRRAEHTEESHRTRAYLSPVRWYESARHAFFPKSPGADRSEGSEGRHAQMTDERTAEAAACSRTADRDDALAASSPPIRPFSTEHVTITIARSCTEKEGLPGSPGSWAPTDLLAAITGNGIEGRSKKQTVTQEELARHEVLTKNQRRHDNVWDQPLRVVRDEDTGKVVGYTLPL